jgi:hypothetical protein
MNTNTVLAHDFTTTQVDYTQLSEAELLRAALAGENGAWRELQRRYGKTVHDRISWVALKYSSLLDSDAVEEMEQDFWCSLVWNDMAKLRAFKPKRGRRKTFRRLGSWLSMLALRSALSYVDKKCHREQRGGVIDKLLDETDGTDDVEGGE